MTESPFDKALAHLTNFGAAEYQRGFRDALQVARQIQGWLNEPRDVTFAQIHEWATKLIAKAEDSIKCE